MARAKRAEAKVEALAAEVAMLRSQLRAADDRADMRTQERDEAIEERDDNHGANIELNEQLALAQTERDDLADLILAYATIEMAPALISAARMYAKGQPCP